MKFSRLIEPGFLGGFRLLDLVDLYRGANWRIDGRYLPRASMAMTSAAFSSLMKPIDDWIAGQSDQVTRCDQPIFILGLHRSGTTLLQRLLACDPGMCHPTRLDCFYPYSFLSLRRFGLAWLFGLVPAKARYMDDIEAGWLSPEEDVFALMVLGAFGKRLSAVFPRMYPDFSDVERSMDYKSALIFFVRKLEQLHGRRVVLKSEIHMSQIPNILKVFPQAKFLMIFRNPVARSISLKAMHNSPGRDWCALQSAPPVEHYKALDHSARLVDRYFADRVLVPEGNLVEIRYEDLVEDMPNVLSGAYERLGLHSWDDAFRVIKRRGPVPKIRERSCYSLSPKWLERTLEAHRAFYDRGYYPMPEAVTKK